VRADGATGPRHQTTRPQAMLPKLDVHGGRGHFQDLSRGGLEGVVPLPRLRLLRQVSPVHREELPLIPRPGRGSTPRGRGAAVEPGAAARGRDEESGERMEVPRRGRCLLRPLHAEK
ncbi:unnamed protein product, partial [Polarella glacialis]